MASTGSKRRAPDFVCIGAQKAGTTWLHANLATHPGVWLPPVKELHHFDELHLDARGHRAAAGERRREKARAVLAAAGDDRSAAARAAALLADGSGSDDWYTRLFALAPADAVCGEITPAYALLPPAGVDHLVSVSPAVRILFLVRDPIDRAWSQIRMRLRAPGPHDAARFGPLRDLELDPRVLMRSRYSETLRVYRTRVPEARLWIGDHDLLGSDPEALLRSACRFLGVGYAPELFPHLAERRHEGAAATIEPRVYERLKAALEPEYEALAGALPEQAARWRERHYA
jgi:hypothetical protein